MKIFDSSSLRLYSKAPGALLCKEGSGSLYLLTFVICTGSCSKDIWEYLLTMFSLLQTAVTAEFIVLFEFQA